MELIYPRKRTDVSKFLMALPKFFSDATTVFIEGTSIADDVIKCLLSYSDGVEYDLISQSLTISSFRYRCIFSQSLFDELARLSTYHASPEICDHMLIYKDDKPVFIWYDAFWGNIEISPEVPMSTINQFALEFGLEIL